MGVYICAQYVWENDCALHLINSASVCVDVQPFVLSTPNICVLFRALLCNNLYYNLQNLLLQSKNINKLFISDHAQLIINK